jgi:hypothetical protein
VFLAVIGLAFVLIRWLQAPRAGSERLVMTVWAAFGPFSSAESAETNLRHVARIVFGEQGIGAHEQWIRGHGENFRAWEADGSLESAQKIMCGGLRTNMYGKTYMEAYAATRQSFVEQVKEGTAWLNKDFLEQTGHRLEPVEQADGSLNVQHKKIWSDEQIEQKKREDNDAILNAVGKNISNDESVEARRLLAFLSNVYAANADKEIKTARDIGLAWLPCLKLEDQAPNSELAKTFKGLNDAWDATRQGQEQA